MSRSWARVNVPQNGWSAGYSNEAASMLDRDDGVDELGEARLPLRGAAIGSSPASLVTRAVSDVRSPRRSRKIVGVTPADSGRGQRLVLVDRAGRAFAPRRGRLRLGGAGGGSLVALGEGLAGDEAGGLGRLGGDPGGVGLERQALERASRSSSPPPSPASR